MERRHRGAGARPICSSRPGRPSAGRASTSASRPAIRRKNYQWGTMEGGSTAGYFAIRMKSDIIYEPNYNGVVTQEKYCTRPGLLLRPDPADLDRERRAARLHQRRPAAAHAGRRRRRHRREIHGERGRRSGRHARLRRHGAHAHAGFHARAQDQEAAGVQPDQGEPRGASAARWRRNTTSR